MKYSFVILLISFAILACRAQDDDDNDDSPVGEAIKNIKDMIKNKSFDKKEGMKILQQLTEKITGDQNANDNEKSGMLGKMQGFLDKIKGDLPKDMMDGAKKFFESAKRGFRQRTTTDSSAD